MKPRPGYEPVELEKRCSWSKATVATVYLKCEGKCWCGSKERLEIDHRVPIALGGSNHPDNLWLLCYVHHKEKTGKSDVPAIAKAKRVGAKDRGEKPQKFVRKITSRGFEKGGPKQKIPSRPWPGKVL